MNPESDNDDMDYDSCHADLRVRDDDDQLRDDEGWPLDDDEKEDDDEGCGEW